MEAVGVFFQLKCTLFNYLLRGSFYFYSILGKSQESSSLRLPKGSFKASSHDLYIYEPRGKGENNPKRIGRRLQSTVRAR